jgi:hypothetical protein
MTPRTKKRDGMAIDVSDLSQKMVRAAANSLKGKWPSVKDFAEAEFKHLAETLALIIRLKAEGKITEDQAKLHLDIQKNTTRMVLLTAEGLALLPVEAAINAALKVVRDAINSAIGFALI